MAVKQVAAEDQDHPNALRDVVAVKQALPHAVLGGPGQDRHDQVKQALADLVVHQQVLRPVQRFVDRPLLLLRLDGRDDPHDLLRHRQIGLQYGLGLPGLGLEHHADHLLQHLLLALEVVIIRTLGDARRLDDLVHAGVLIAPGNEHPVGDLKQIPLPALSLFHVQTPFRLSVGFIVASSSPSVKLIFDYQSVLGL